MQQLKEDSGVRNWVVLSKCSAGLAVVALIALIGASDGRREERASAQTAAQVIQTAEQQRRQVLEERRLQTPNAERIAQQQAPFEGPTPVIVQ
jgi:type II secretory pathway pseudopilin PulG